MSFFSPKYELDGPGVPKDEPQRIGPIRYFIVLGRKFWNIVLLNLLYVVFSLPALVLYSCLGGVVLTPAINLIVEGSGNPDYLQTPEGSAVILLLIIAFAFLMVAVLGSGPATAGIAYVLRNYSREEHAWVWSDFKDAAKNNRKQSLVVFLVDLLFVFILYIDVATYAQMENATLASLTLAFAAVLIILYSMMHPYLYVLMVTFKMNLRQLYKNAFILTAVRIFQNIAVSFVVLVFLLLVLYLFTSVSFLFIVLIATIFFAFAWLGYAMNSFSVAKKYLIPDDEENN